jgi:flagellar hook assembly protein FlgD
MGCTGVVPPGGDVAAIANFMKLGNSVVRSGAANVRFGVATTGRVRVRLYDVAGRVVRTLAERVYAGDHEYSVPWDGLDDAGRALARGVYFARIDYASGAAISGRIVMLR